MATRKRQTRSSIPRYLTIAGVICAGVLLTYGVGRAAGWIGGDNTASNNRSRVGMVKVPKSLVTLNAYDVVKREDIYDRTIGDDSYFWMPKSRVENNPQWITRVDDIIGRVMSKDKRIDFVFTENDFLPKGSRSGIAGGIPAGKQGFFLDAEKIPGLRFLKSGDRFDLLASTAEETETAGSEYGLLLGGIKARGGKPIPLSGVRILAQDAEMTAITTSGRMTTQGGLELAKADERGRSLANEKNERVAIAIDPTEAVPLTQALGDKVNVYMVTRSGQESESAAVTDVLKGRIGIAATGVSIEPYKPIKASDLSEPATGELRQYFFKPEDVRDDWIARPEQLVGRVVKRAIEPGYIFTEGDFLTANSLIADVKAFQSIQAGDIVDGLASPLVGRVVSRDLTAGSPVTESELLQPGSVTEAVEAYQVLTANVLAERAQSSLVGRVVARDLQPGTKVSEDDLLPPGSAAGFAAAIPTGRMALTVDQDSIAGIGQLQRAQHCDLLASRSFDADSTLAGVQIAPNLQAQLQSQAVNRVLAKDVIVIQQRGDQSVLAMKPNEVSEIARAVTQGVNVFSVARSAASGPPAPTNVPASATTDLVSDPSPLGQISITETLIGGRRSVNAYKRSVNKPPVFLPNGGQQ